MRNNGLRPRAVGALSVVALSLFLLLCLFNYGQAGVAEATEPALHLTIAGWFVGVFGVGAFAMVLLPLTWGVVVYFREDTPSLGMRAVGTLLLACSIAMVCGLLQAPGPGLWAGAIGAFTVDSIEWVGGLLGGTYGGPLASATTWLASVVLFVVSLIWATDWMFHSLRRGPIAALPRTRQSIATESFASDLREPDEGPTERMFVATRSAAEDASERLATQAAEPGEPVPVPKIPDGFSARRTADRMVLRGPVGYEGVEFLPTSDELAPPARPEERVVAPTEPVRESSFDDEMFDLPAAAATAAEVVPPPVFEEPATVLETAAEPEPEAVEEPTAEVATVIPVDDAPAPAPERPRSGIGLPVDSPFVDEFFPVDTFVEGPAPAAAATDDAARDPGPAPAGSDASPQTTDMPLFARSPTVADTPPAELVPPAGQASAERSRSVEVRGEPVIVDEVVFTTSDYMLIDDEIPGPIAERAASRPAAASRLDETRRPAGVDLTRIDSMQLDPLFLDAADAVVQSGRGSPMLLQRRFGVGHQRGVRLLEQMAEAGLLGPEDAAGSREIRVDAAAWREFSAARSS